MCPAKVECPDGHSFILPEEGVLDERIGTDFDHIPEEDKTNLQWDSVFGTKQGFDIFCEGRQQAIVHVTPKIITYDPPGDGYILNFSKNNIFILSGGTSITPIDNSKE